MKNNKGVTLASLTVYIIVLAIVLILLTFISANFTARLAETASRGKVSNECIKLYSFLLDDVKASNQVVEYSDDFVRFDNDVRYSIKYLYTLDSKERQTKQYEVYRNNVLIAENLLDVGFDYSPDNNVFILNMRYYFGKTLVNKMQSFKIGRGY